MSKNENKRPGAKKKWVTWSILLVVLALVGWGVSWLVGGGDEDKAPEPTFVVAQGNLLIDVSERGTIQNREKVVLRSKVPGKVAIVSLLDEGDKVKKGDLIIELENSALLDKKEAQEISLSSAEAGFVQATVNLEIVKNQAVSNIMLAKQDYVFALDDLKKHVEGEHPLALEKAEAQITLAQETLELAADKVEWSEKLAKEGYIMINELRADRSAWNKAKLDLSLAKGALKLLKQYTNKRQLATYKSNIVQMKQALERVERKAKADTIQAEAGLKNKKSLRDQRSDILDETNINIADCRIVAPIDGVVVYATTGKFSWRGATDPLEKGTEVRLKQELIHIPVTSKMITEVKIQEESLRKIKKGQPVLITVDALIGKTFHGTVERISPYPDGTSVWLNPDLKVYSTEVSIQTHDASLRAGMGCEAQIVVQQLTDVLYIPVQAVVRVGSKPTVYVRQPDGTFQPRTVEAGLDNETMIHIKSGLEAGEEVWLAPPLDVGKKEDESGRAAQSKLLLKNRAPQAPATAPKGAAGTPATPSKPKRRKRPGKKPAASSK